ncbi:SIR2 family protein [Cytophaga aurantiaca]|uniref:SIR2 family protein n=1 Tax=Cytophaga aurantiaca TaxID=29530 RepID=UPI00036098DA|nr:SIR2 family protein [Cytophaga aurantiaca]
MKNTVFLIGNDINNATASYSWENLLKDLTKFTGLKALPNMLNKPFPLVYEEIILKTLAEGKVQENDLKKFIASKIALLKPNSIHHAIASMGVQHIFTTNYDSTLEEAVNGSVKKIHNIGSVKEVLFSLFRKNQIGKTNFWHIHGCAAQPQSITLGFEHYGGYLQHMRNYVVAGTKDTYKDVRFSPLELRIKKNKITHVSWVDFFFTHDIEIFGLNLDVVEVHLWWLLTYRARMKATNKLTITNRIRYYYPKKYELSSKHKLELLKACGVEVVGLPMNDGNRIGYYEKVLKKIRS